jgi:hypothetical protein
MRNKVMPERVRMRYAVGALTVVTVLGAQAAPALAAEPSPAATGAVAGTAAGKVEQRAAPLTVEAAVDAAAASVTITWTLPADNDAEVAFRLHGETDIECPVPATASGSCELTAVPVGVYTVQFDEAGDGWVPTDVNVERRLPRRQG